MIGKGAFGKVYTAKEVITSNKDNQVVHESKIFALKQVTHLSA